VKLPFIQWLIQGIPECIAVIALGLALIEKKLLLGKALLPGLIQASILFLLRQLPLPYGFHTLIGFLSLAVLLSYFSRINFSRAVVVSFFVHTLLGLSEYIVFSAAAYLLNLSLETIMHNPILAALIGLPQVFVLFFLSFLLGRQTAGRSA